MSVYQYVAFRAIDRALSKSELEFAKRQSSRAEVSRWSFQCEYNYSEFRGDVTGLLRHGYDVHLDYANYGTRVAAFRLPAGLPFPESQSTQYIDGEELCWLPDQQGPGGILMLAPDCDGGNWDQLDNVGGFIDDLVIVRERLLEGDAGALYALWMCAAFFTGSVDPDLREPPVPAGLAQSADVFSELLQFFGLDPLLIAAAAEESPEGPSRTATDARTRAWLDRQSERDVRNLLQRFLLEDPTDVKAETVSTIRDAETADAWPTAELSRTCGDLSARMEAIRAEETAAQQQRAAEQVRREAAVQERQRKKRMREMVREPTVWLAKATQLVKARGTENYNAAADMLADLRESIGGEEGTQLTRAHAAKLVRKNPTLNRLKAALRKRDLL